MAAHSVAEAEIVAGGFAEPVTASSAVFRAVMDAMARPGRIAAVPAPAAPPAPMGAIAGALALTLLDQDTPVWLCPELAASQALAAWLTFHTAAPRTPATHEAQFALAASGGTMPALEALSLGTQEYPDRSTTLIVTLQALAGGAGLRLTGPGIREAALVAPKGLPDRFFGQWRANGALYPRGVDLILCGPDAILALPRTTRIERLEG